MKKKVLVFNGYYVPAKNYGGPLTSMLNIVNTCSDQFLFYIISNNHDFNSSEVFDVETDKWLKVGKAQVMYVKGSRLNYSKKEMGVLINSVCPDIIWFAGILTPQKKIIGTIIARKNNIPVLFSPRGELDGDRVRIKGYKKIPYLWLLRLTQIYKNCFFHATSADEIKGIKKFLSIPDSNIFFVPNIALTKQASIESTKKRAGVLHAFFLSRIHPVKNLQFALECLSSCKKTIYFDIYGPIENKEYWNSCQDTIARLENNVHVCYKGYLDHDNMSSTIQKYDCLFLPTINENYGHVIAETLANSRPVVISKGTTPWDDLDGVAGYAIDLSNSEGFSKKLDFLASMDANTFHQLIEKVSQYFDESPLINEAIKGHLKMLKTITDL